MNNPYISIIVPVYKVENYIRECIESIICQNGNWELILVDDGSPDACPAICDEYAEKDERVQVIHKKNGGVSTARNAGLDIARGEWVWLVDGDDFVTGNEINNCIDKIKRCDSDYVQFGHTRIEEETGNRQIIKTDDVIGEEKNDFFIKYAIYTHWCVWYKREMIERHNLRFSEGLRMAEDLEFMYLYQLYVKKPIQLNVNLYNYRIRKESAVRNANSYRNGIDDSFVVLDHWLERIKKEQISIEPWIDSKINIFVKRLLYYAWHVLNLDKKIFHSRFCNVIRKYKNAGFYFPGNINMRIAFFNITLYFVLNRAYLKFKGLE